nr:cation:proton antiporter [Chondromyces crocatus]
MPKGARQHVIHALVLLLLFALLYAGTRAVPGLHGPAATIASAGFLLLAGTLASELVEPLGLPHLSGYILAGVLAGPHVLHLVDHETVEELSSVNSLALALIALAGGSQLRMAMLREGLKSISLHHVLQLVLVLPVMGAVFYFARPLIPFAAALSVTSAIGVALLWGAFAMCRSSAATLGILSQTRATGPLAQHSLAFVMTSDVLAIVLTAFMITVARPLVVPGATMAMKDFEALGRVLLGSVALGTTLGLALAAYLRLVGKQTILVFVALGFGATTLLRYLQFNPLLVFMTAGFVVMNLSTQGEKLIQAVQDAASVVFVLFFATAGAHLDLPLLGLMWPVALLLGGSRALASFGAAKLAGRLAGDAPVLRRWSWAALVSQAGLALGLGFEVERAYPSLGRGFGALVVACVALNELAGPVLFKLALDRAGESAAEAERVDPGSQRAEALLEQESR